MRSWIQAAAAVLQNAYLAFPWTHNIYQGPLKRACTPGLNCHSCPAAVLACPLGGLQHFLAGLRPALRWGTFQLGLSVIGFLMLVGLVGGRFPCGWLCPFGFLQDLLHRIPSPKRPIPRSLEGLRYAALGITVLLLPLLAVNQLGYGDAWFCRLLCPAGTLEAGGLFFLEPALTEQLGGYFALKLAVLVVVLGWAVVGYRPYCRVLCPLGTIYGLFNRWSLVRVQFDAGRCRDCGSCEDACRAQRTPRRATTDSRCLRCFTCVHRCPSGALRVNPGTRERRSAASDG